jgi:simple sugar transport system substrate-binding protein/ribose transport system substrate-binding protein
MKKQVSVFLAAAMIAALVTGCRKSEAAADGGLKIAGIVLQDDEFQTMLAEGMKDAAAEAGVPIDSQNTNSDQSREVELINTYVAQDYKGICIAPLDPITSIAALRAASKEGLKVTTVNMELSNVDFLLGGYCSDDFANGKLIGERAAAYIKSKYNRAVKIAIIDYDHQLPAQSKNRYGGFLAALDEAGVVYVIVGQQSAEKEDLGLIAADGIIAANPDVDIFYGANAGGLIGAVNAVKQSAIARSCVAFGYDGNDVITALLQDSSNILQGVVAQDPYTQGYKAVQLLISNLKGENTGMNGTTIVVPGQILMRGDTDAIAKYRKDNGFN